MNLTAVLTSLRDLTHTQIEAHPGSGPHSISELILEELGDDPTALREALADCLPGYVGSVISQRRNSTLNQITPPAASERKLGQPISANQQAIRDWHTRFLQETLHVTDGYKTIGECTRADLMFAVEERQSHAARELARAAQYRSLAELLPDATSTVASLPREAVEAWRRTV